ncbi:hypothetical protein K1719_000626 [Acacia pycnantha]|nr:hypothetical protein K1719_000626 [Acacia pycnantha]
MWRTHVNIAVILIGDVLVSMGLPDYHARTPLKRLSCKDSFEKLSGILLGTAILKYPHCPSKDKYVTLLLLNGAGRFGCNCLYQLCISE